MPFSWNDPQWVGVVVNFAVGVVILWYTFETMLLRFSGRRQAGVISLQLDLELTPDPDVVKATVVTEDSANIRPDVPPPYLLLQVRNNRPATASLPMVVLRRSSATEPFDCLADWGPYGVLGPLNVTVPFFVKEVVTNSQLLNEFGARFGNHHVSFLAERLANRTPFLAIFYFDPIDRIRANVWEIAVTAGLEVKFVSFPKRYPSFTRRYSALFTEDATLTGRLFRRLILKGKKLWRGDLEGNW
jgi:hypothetical protein